MSLIESEAEQLARLIVQQTALVENLLMATKADLEAALSRLQSAVTSKVQDVSDHLAAMQQTLEQFQTDDATEDANYEAQIADLRAQLAAQLDDAVTSVNALTEAVNRPA